MEEFFDNLVFAFSKVFKDIYNYFINLFKTNWEIMTR